MSSAASALHFDRKVSRSAFRRCAVQGTADSYMARKARERREAIQNVANALDAAVQTNDNDA